MAWVWEEIDETRSGSSGDVSKLFRNEQLKRPGVLALSAPGPDATLMAREVIQNSWDAAQDLRARIGEDPDFDLAFRFQTLTGSRRQELIDHLDLEQQAERALRHDPRDLGVPEDSFLRDFDGGDLRILSIEESGTSGMYGPWRGDQSRMYLALVSIGFTQKAEGSGGSYGYGKAGLIRGSASRMVVAYSCFREEEDDPGITRRLLGMTYWGPHKESGVTYNGFARFGQSSDDGTARPFENDDADEVARKLGLRVRTSARVEDLGTTFLVLDPTVEPEGLRDAIERNWWPVLESDRTFGVEIIDDGGEVHFPQPKQNEALRPFIRALELARDPKTEAGRDEYRLDLQKSETGLQLGSLALVGDRDDWSYPSAEDGIDHRSLVALVRGPKMVVEYLETGTTKPFVRGTFVAHDDVDDLLRQTEPKGHDAWQSTIGDESTDPRAPIVAAEIQRRVQNAVYRFRSGLKPPKPDRREVRLPEMERLFELVLKGEGDRPKPPPPPPPRDVGISILEQSPEEDPADRSRIRMRAKVGFHLTEHFADGNSAPVRLRLQYKFLEDSRVGENCPLNLVPPEGFEQTDGDLHGELVRDEPAVVEAVSAGYSPDWTGQLIAEGEVLAGTPAEGGGHE